MKKPFKLNFGITYPARPERDRREPAEWKNWQLPTLNLPNGKMAKSSRGFTLVELLVVIGVLGVLATGLLIAINPAQQLAKARNAARKNSLKQMADALERYRVANGRYPPSGYCAASGSSWYNCGAEWIPGLVTSRELKILPTDPRQGQVFLPCNRASYTYYIYVSNGTDYKIIAHCTLEGPPPANDPFLDPRRPSYSWAIGTPTGMATW
jgi:prepilin-type N-terminal cleavage/methylation domain-containing protein